MTIIKNRRGTASQWTTANPVLAEGEIGFETDTGKHKIGNGVSAWLGLHYFVDESSLSATYALLLSTITDNVQTAVDGPLTLGTLTSIDGSSSARTMTLADGTRRGQVTAAEKSDSVVANAVTVTGSIRVAGGGGSITLTYQHETILFVWMGTFWFPLVGHRTKSSLDAQMAAVIAADPTLASAVAAAAGPAVATALATAGVLNAAQAPALDATRVPDPQLKTSGGVASVPNYTLSRITTGLPAGFSYGVETVRAGTPTGVITQIYGGSKTQTDPLRILVTPGETITAAAYLWTDQASARGRIDLIWYDASGAVLSTTTGSYTNFAGASTWEQRVMVGVVPASAAYVTPQCATSTQTGNTVVGAKARMTGLMVLTGTFVAPVTYTDGGTIGWAWSGTAHASIAKKVFLSTTDIDTRAQAKVDAHVAASDPHPVYLRKTKVPVLATNRALDPQVKTAGATTSGAAYTVSHIAAGLPTGFAYGLESVRIGTANQVIGQIILAPSASGDPLRIAVTPGETITAQASVWTDQASAKARLDIFWYDSAGTIVLPSTIGTYTNIGQNAWETRATSAVVPVGVAFAAPATAVSTQSGNTVLGAKTRATGLIIVTGSTAPTYGDGTSSGWDWTGTAHASTSVQLFATTTTVATDTRVLSLVKNGNALTLTRPFNGSQILTQTMSLNGSANGAFNLLTTKVDGTQIHDTGDDICPIRAQNGTMGANHGYSNVGDFANPDGKTTADLGSVYHDTAGREYVLLAITSGGRLLVGGSYTGTIGTTPTVSANVAPVTDLTWVSGGTHHGAITVASQNTTSGSDLTPIIQRIAVTLWADGKQITADGTYTAAEVVVRETYSILDYGALYDAAKANVGTPFSSLTIAGCVRVSNVYRWASAGCRVTCELTELKPTTLGQCGGVQSFRLQDGTSTVTRYLPGTAVIGGNDWGAGVDITAWASPGTTSNIVATGDILNSTRPPSLSVDTLSVGGVVSVGYALGYLPYGARSDDASRASQRLSHASTKLWDLRNTGKNYPTFTTAEAAGWDHLVVEAFRVYLDPTQTASLLASKGDAASAWQSLNTQADLVRAA